MKRLIVDGHNLATRSYYTGNLFNFYNMIRGALGDVEPESLIVVFDDNKSCWRRRLYPAYKDNRQEKPQDLITYLDILPRTLIDAHIPFAHWDEADDYIYTITRTQEHQDIILSSDKDLYGAVNDWTKILGFNGSFSEREFIGDSRVLDIIGVPPSRFSLYKALVGDSSDNVGGVNKIGPKKALDIMNTYAPTAYTVQELYDCQNLPQKYLDLLIPGYDQAVKCEKVLSLQLCLDLDGQPIIWNAPKIGRDALYTRVDLAAKSLQKRLEKTPLLTI